MTRKRSAASSCEQAESVRQSVQDLFWAEDSRSDGRELDGQRQTVEPAAKIHDRRLVRGGQLEIARCRRGTFGKQPDRLVLSQLSERLDGVRRRQLKGRDRDNMLTCHG